MLKQDDEATGRQDYGTTGPPHGGKDQGPGFLPRGQDLSTRRQVLSAHTAWDAGARGKSGATECWRVSRGLAPLSPLYGIEGSVGKTRDQNEVPRVNIITPPLRSL